MESQFTLAEESRLPKWFGTSVTQSRSQVDIELSYWGPGWGGNAVVIMRDKTGRTLARVVGQSCWHPATRWVPNPDGKTFTAPFIRHTIITANEIMDVVEHRREPRFYMTDNEKLIQQARESIGRGECRASPD